MVPPDVPVFFVPRRAHVEPGESILYRPAILGVARLHYADKKAGVDHWETLALLQPVGEAMPAEPWAGSLPFDDGVPELDKAPEAGARFAPLPPELARAKCYADWTKSLKNYLYRERTLDLWACPEVKEYSRPAEAEREFRLRVAQASREQRDREVEALRAKYAPKKSALEDQIRRRPRAAGARAVAGEQIDLGRDGRPGQLGPGRALRPQGALPDQRDPRRDGRPGRRPGRAAARRRRLGRRLARGRCNASTPSSPPSSARRWSGSTPRSAPRP